MLRKKSLLLCLFLPLLFVGCADDAQVEGPALTGRWEVEQAFRNGRTTESLDGLFLDFRGDGTFITNLDGEESTGNYQLDDQTILTSGVPLSMEYLIVSLTDSSLNVKSTFRKYRFDFKLRRVYSEAHTG